MGTLAKIFFLVFHAALLRLWEGKINRDFRSEGVNRFPGPISMHHLFLYSVCFVCSPKRGFGAVSGWVAVLLRRHGGLFFGVLVFGPPLLLFLMLGGLLWQIYRTGKLKVDNPLFGPLVKCPIQNRKGCDRESAR